MIVWGLSPPFKKNQSSSYSLNCSHEARDVEWRVNHDSLPPGLSFYQGVIQGIPEQSGEYALTVSAEFENERVKQDYKIHVLGKNMAPTAQKILLAAQSKAAGSVTECTAGSPLGNCELLRDGKIGPDYYSSYNPLLLTEKAKKYGCEI